MGMSTATTVLYAMFARTQGGKGKSSLLAISFLVTDFYWKFTLKAIDFSKMRVTVSTKRFVELKKALR